MDRDKWWMLISKGFNVTKIHYNQGNKRMYVLNAEYMQPGIYMYFRTLSVILNLG